MNQLHIKRKKCKSAAVCTVCLNSIKNKDSFIDCEKCGLSIHKICFKLSGDLLKIFQDFEARNEKFPFTILCPGCRQFPPEPIDKVVDDSEDKIKIKNPFEIDCIVKVILEHLNIQDLANIRLVNSLWNQNASSLLSKESRQVQIRACDLMRHNSNLDKCLQFMMNSKEKNLFQKLSFVSNRKGQDQDQDQINRDLKCFNEIAKISNPKYVIIDNFTIYICNLEQHTLFSNFLFNISENVVDLEVEFQKTIGFDPTQFCMPKFSKLKSLVIENLDHENYQFVKMVIENSPKLMNLGLNTCNEEDCVIDNFLIPESGYCVLPEKSAQNLQSLDLYDTNLNFDTESFQMKLKSLSLHFYEAQDVKFDKLKTFLTSQIDTLENLKLGFGMLIEVFVQIIDVADLETVQMDLPILTNLKEFSLEFDFHQIDRICNINEEIWPLKSIHLTEKLPNLNKVSIKYCQSWALSFVPDQKCRSVTELVLIKWTDGDLTKLVEIFPQVEVLNLKKFCFNSNFNHNTRSFTRDKIYTQLDNLDGWAGSLKRIEISCEYYHLENFDFEKLVCLANLKSIKISKTNGLVSDVISSHFIYPDFKPLFKIEALSQMVIKNFKISKGIIEDLREKYPSLDYSFYPK